MTIEESQRKTREYMRELRKDPEYKKQFNIWCKKRHHSPEGWPVVTLRKVRARAKRKGLEFNLTSEDFIMPEYCPILGIKIEYKDPSRENSPSVDRVDNSKGYIKGNVKIISNRANRIKSDASLEELKKIVSYIETHNA